MDSHSAGYLSVSSDHNVWFHPIFAEHSSRCLTSLSFLSIAFKEALRHRMHNSVSLIHLSAGIALARNSFFINFRHPIPALVTILVFGVTKLLVSRYARCSVLQETKDLTMSRSWTTLLTPTLVTWTVNASALELDLTSSWFESALRQELGQSGAALGDVESLNLRHCHSQSDQFAVTQLR